MRRMLYLLAALTLGAAVVFAAPGITISFQTTTAAQDSYIQATIIPEVNAELCARFGLPPSCTGAQLTTAGCVAAPLDAVSKQNLVYRNCSPFAQSAAGENLLAADAFARELLAQVSNDRQADQDASCAAFKAASGATQNSICTTLGRSNGCSICP